MISSGRVRLFLSLLAVALLYLATLPRHLTFEDAGLFNQVCHLNGIAHPPGYPLFTAICVPLYAIGFDPVVTGNLISALFAIGTLALLYLVMRELGASSITSAISVFTFGVSLDFWSQAIIVEVYTLNTLITAGLLLLSLKFLREPRPEHLIGLAFVGGLGLANHWPLIAASTPGLAFILLGRWQPVFNLLQRPLVLLACLLALMIGLSPYLYMYLRPEGTFGYSGYIETLSDLMSYIGRESFSDVDQSEFANSGDKLQFLGWFFLRLFEQVNWALGLLIIYGFYLSFINQRWNTIGVALILLGNSAVLIALLGFDFTYPFQTAFSHYPLVAYMCWFIWLAVGLDAALVWLKSSNRQTTYIAAAFLTTVLIATCYNNYLSNNRRDDDLAQRYVDTLLASLPPNAIVVADADAPVATLGFMQRVIGARTDITFYEADNAFSQQTLFGTNAEKRDYLLNLANQQTVYAIEIDWLPTTTDHGLFQEVGDSKKVGYAPEPEYLLFINEIADKYRMKHYQDRFSYGFVHQSLIAAGQYLVGRMQTGSASEDEIQTLIKIQQTFPGATGAVSAALFRQGTTQAVNDQSLLLALLRPHEDNFPDPTTPAEIAQFYYLLAALHSGSAVATDYLKEAYDAMPLKHNPVCQIEVEFETDC